MPIDIEKRRIPRAWSVLQDVEPPGITRLRNAHMVWHRVEDLPHLVLAERLGEITVGVFRADFRIQRPRIGNVIPMQAAGCGL